MVTWDKYLCSLLNKAERDTNSIFLCGEHHTHMGKVPVTTVTLASITGLESPGYQAFIQNEKCLFQFRPKANSCARYENMG